MYRICFDTDVVVSYFRDASPMSDNVQRWLDDSKAKVFITSVTSFERYHGAFYSNNPEQSVEELEIFLENIGEILPFTAKSSKIAGEIISDLRKRQSIIDVRDLFIGAVCIENEISLLTQNVSHFKRIRGLKIE